MGEVAVGGGTVVAAATIPDVEGTDVGLVASVVGGGTDVGVGGPAAIGLSLIHI